MKLKHKFANWLRAISDKFDPPKKKTLLPFDDPTYGLPITQTIRSVERLACQYELRERDYAFTPVEEYPEIEGDVYRRIAESLGTQLLTGGFIKIEKRNEHCGTIRFDAVVEAVKPYTDTFSFRK